MTCLAQTSSPIPHPSSADSKGSTGLSLPLLVGCLVAVGVTVVGTTAYVVLKMRATRSATTPRKPLLAESAKGERRGARGEGALADDTSSDTMTDTIDMSFMVRGVVGGGCVGCV